MQFLNISKEILTGFVQGLGADWWVEVTTSEPQCTYYFGPFNKAAEAEAARPGYIEDLEAEGAQGIRVVVKRCKPASVTISE